MPVHTIDDPVTVSPLADLSARLPACVILPGYPTDGGRAVTCSHQPSTAHTVPAWHHAVEPTSDRARLALILDAVDILHESHPA